VEKVNPSSTEWPCWLVGILRTQRSGIQDTGADEDQVLEEDTMFGKLADSVCVDEALE
jgi:hypothetical protein